ncbi:MAG: hypothetical protein KBC84_00460 [Proteobacteria bacterium]|nr:hypothetical protein [Pseudomonadota bacterium]
MSQSKLQILLKGLVFSGIISSVGLYSCVGGGSTEGGQGQADAGLGEHPVSDGGFGSTLRISLEGGAETIPTAGRVGFFVDALDPNGQPLADRRVFCESEKGIAILEPSKNGVAFEHTSSSGRLSGVLGGVTPGSFLLECRLEQGANVVAREHFKVIGDVPAGFAGFPGAAGGNLGGGVIVDNPNTDDEGDVAVTSILFLTNGGTTADIGLIDIHRTTLCSDNNPEPYTFDNYQLTFKNPLLETVTIDSVTITIAGTGLSVTKSIGVTVPASTDAQTYVGLFDDNPNGGSTKYLAGDTSSPLPTGTYNVSFEVEGTTANGVGFSTSTSTSVTFAFVDNCP